MAANSSLYILKILEEHSDESHPLSKNDILDYLEKEHDLSMEEKQFFRKIEELDEAGFNVEKTRGRYSTYYLDRTSIKPNELIFLISMIKGNESISKKETEKIISELLRIVPLTFESEKQLFTFIDSINVKKTKIDNLSNFRVVLEAIERKNEIRFKQILETDNEFIFSTYQFLQPISFNLNKGSLQISGIKDGKAENHLLEEMINIEIYN